MTPEQIAEIESIRAAILTARANPYNRESADRLEDAAERLHALLPQRETAWGCSDKSDRDVADRRSAP